MDDPRLLDGDDLATWTALHYLLLRLPPALDAHSRALTGLTDFEFAVLAQLITSPTAGAKMGALAAGTGASPSRLSNVVGRLEKRGLLARVPADDDRRATVAAATAAGRALFDDAVGPHSAELRRLVLDPLTAAQQRTLREIARRLLAALDPLEPSAEDLAPHPSLPSTD